MLRGARMPLKIKQKMNKILNTFLRTLWTENLNEMGAAVGRRMVPGIENLPIRHTPSVTPCSPRGGRRIEDASRRHTAAPLLLG